MSSFPDAEIELPRVRAAGLSPRQFAAIGVLFALLGLSTIWFTGLSLWTLWTNDALKSIGMVIPLVSLVLFLRVWRSLDWQAAGSWWGLVLLLMTIVVARFQQQAILILVISPHWSTVLPPPSFTLFAYGSGVVLLLGGGRLYRAALFPIVLLCFANPIPHVFSSMIDMPLQHASAHIARSFAMHLGHSLTPDNLRLMFTPDFGMFIAPGCDGIRGSLTMGFIALITGYVYRFRWYANGLVVMGAVLLGYLFNLVRLCLLVLYYMVALHFPSLQDKAKNADYVIGGSLFLVATLLLFTVVQRLRDARGPSILPVNADPDAGRIPDRSPRRGYARLAAMGLVALIGCAGLGQAKAMIDASAKRGANLAAARFPEKLGNYSLVRSWNETDLAGPVVYVWGQYVSANGGTPIALGVSPLPDYHDPVLCHTVRGDDPLWQGQLRVATAGGVPVNFSSGFFSDGVTRHIEASTMCRGTNCGEFTTERTHFGFVYTHPDPSFLVGEGGGIPIRVLLRVETTDMEVPAEAEREQLTEDVRSFLASVRLDELTRPYGQ